HFTQVLQAQHVAVERQHGRAVGGDDTQVYGLFCEFDAHCSCVSAKVELLMLAGAPHEAGLPAVQAYFSLRISPTGSVSLPLKRTGWAVAKTCRSSGLLRISTPGSSILGRKPERLVPSSRILSWVSSSPACSITWVMICETM